MPKRKPFGKLVENKLPGRGAASSASSRSSRGSTATNRVPALDDRDFGFLSDNKSVPDGATEKVDEEAPKKRDLVARRVVQNNEPVSSQTKTPRISNVTLAAPQQRTSTALSATTNARPPAASAKRKTNVAEIDDGGSVQSDSSNNNRLRRKRRRRGANAVFESQGTTTGVDSEMQPSQKKTSIQFMGSKRVSQISRKSSSSLSTPLRTIDEVDEEIEETSPQQASPREPSPALTKHSSPKGNEIAVSDSNPPRDSAKKASGDGTNVGNEYYKEEDDDDMDLASDEEMQTSLTQEYIVTKTNTEHHSEISSPNVRNNPANHISTSDPSKPFKTPAPTRASAMVVRTYPAGSKQHLDHLRQIILYPPSERQSLTPKKTTPLRETTSKSSSPSKRQHRDDHLDPAVDERKSCTPENGKSFSEADLRKLRSNSPDNATLMKAMLAEPVGESSNGDEEIVAEKRISKPVQVQSVVVRKTDEDCDDNMSDVTFPSIQEEKPKWNETTTAPLQPVKSAPRKSPPVVQQPSRTKTPPKSQVPSKTPKTVQAKEKRVNSKEALPTPEYMTTFGAETNAEINRLQVGIHCNDPRRPRPLSNVAPSLPEEAETSKPPAHKSMPEDQRETKYVEMQKSSPHSGLPKQTETSDNPTTPLSKKRKRSSKTVGRQENVDVKNDQQPTEKDAGNAYENGQLQSKRDAVDENIEGSRRRFSGETAINPNFPSFARSQKCEHSPKKTSTSTSSHQVDLSREIPPSSSNQKPDREKKSSPGSESPDKSKEVEESGAESSHPLRYLPHNIYTAEKAGFRQLAPFIRFPNGDTFLHPPLPAGWQVFMCRRESKPYYWHPDFGRTCYPPIHLPSSDGIIHGFTPQYVVQSEGCIPPPGCMDLDPEFSSDHFETKLRSSEHAAPGEYSAMTSNFHDADEDNKNSSGKAETKHRNLASSSAESSIDSTSCDGTSGYSADYEAEQVQPPSSRGDSQNVISRCAIKRKNEIKPAPSCASPESHRKSSASTQSSKRDEELGRNGFRLVDETKDTESLDSRSDLQSHGQHDQPNEENAVDSLGQVELQAPQLKDQKPESSDKTIGQPHEKAYNGDDDNKNSPSKKYHCVAESSERPQEGLLQVAEANSNMFSLSPISLRDELRESEDVLGFLPDSPMQIQADEVFTPASKSDGAMRAGRPSFISVPNVDDSVGNVRDDSPDDVSALEEGGYSTIHIQRKTNKKSNADWRSGSVSGSCGTRMSHRARFPPLPICCLQNILALELTKTSKKKRLKKARDGRKDRAKHSHGRIESQLIM